MASVFISNRPGVEQGREVLAPEYARHIIRLTGVNGDVITLTGLVDGFEVVGDGHDGFGPPDPRFDSTTTPGVDGDVDGVVTYGPRTVAVDVYMQAAFGRSVAGLADRLARAVNPTAGEVILENRSGVTGTIRQVRGRFVGGAAAGVRSVADGVFPLVLRCADEVAWTDTDASQPGPITWTPPAARPWYPFPGWVRPASGQILGTAQTVINDGDLPIYPEWTVTGPTTGFTLSLVDQGVDLKWNGTLTAGQWVRIVTTPGKQQVVDQAGVNRYYQLDQVQEPVFWRLRPGSNVINATVSGVGAGTTLTLASRRRRWLTAG